MGGWGGGLTGGGRGSVCVCVCACVRVGGVGCKEATILAIQTLIRPCALDRSQKPYN